MTKKDYINAAGAFNDSFSEWGATSQLEELTEVFANWFENDNPNFDREKFLYACVAGTDAENAVDYL
jgi:hypothetical protein